MSSQHAPSIASIKDAVAKHYGLTKLELVSRKRHPDVAQPRQLAVALARRLTGHSRNVVGRHFGLHPTTVLHAERAVLDRYTADPRLAESIAALLRELLP